MTTWNHDIPAVGNSITADVADIEENLQELHDIIEGMCSGTVGTTAAGSFLVKSFQPQNMWIPADRMTPTTTNGAAAGSVETDTNDLMYSYLAFDKTTQENADFDVMMPEGWDRGTIKAKFVFIPGTGCAAGETAYFKLAGVAITVGEVIDVAVGTAQNAGNANLPADPTTKIIVTAASSAITIAGSPALADVIHFKVSRDVATDNAAGDLLLLGVWIQFSVTNAVTAW